MIRVIYRWRIKPRNEEAFCRAWQTGTRAILCAVEGAHGSLLMKCNDMPAEFAGMARWESLAAWQEARQSRPWPPNREATRVVHSVAERVGVAGLFVELNDLTDV